MKKQILAALLALLLLLGTMPAAAAETTEVDFGAIAQRGTEESAPGMIMLTQPIYTDCKVDYFYGESTYAAFQNTANGRWGIVDYYGNICWQTADTSVIGMKPCGTGVVAVWRNGSSGCQPYTLNGTRLCQAQAFYNTADDLTDRATGKTVCACFHDPDSSWQQSAFGNAIRSLLVDGAGHSMTVDGYGLISKGCLTYLENGKWGLCRLFDRVLLSPRYDGLAFVSPEVLLAKQNGKYSLIDQSGTVLRSLDGYDEVISAYPASEMLIVTKNGKLGVLDPEGTLRIPCSFERLEARACPDYSAACFEGLKDDIWHFLLDDGTDIDTGCPRSDSCSVSPLGDTAPDAFLKIVLPSDGGRAVTLIDRSGAPMDEAVYTGFLQSGTYTLLYGREDEQYFCSVYNSAAEKSLAFDGFTACALTKDCLVLGREDGVEFYSLSDGTLVNKQENVTLTLYHDWFTVVERDGKYAELDSKGALVTDFSYTAYNVPAGQDVLLLQRGAFWYVLDCTGRELNDVPLDSPVYNGPYSAYQSKGKTGFLKLRQAGDPLFADVSAGDWFARSVDFCSKAGLVNGVGHNRFAPQTVMTRAMLVQVLYNLSGSPCEPYGFTDVPANAWYTNAVNWAAANGIVNGTSATRFSPDIPVTREQMVTILRRYALQFGAADGSETALDGFADAGAVSDFASAAMRWAVSVGLITGKTATRLDPKGQATRAEIATVLMRFVNYMAQHSED